MTSSQSICVERHLFYLIWEVDQAYSIPFMLLILAEAADGMCLLEADVHRFIKSLPSARTALAACGVTVLVVFLGIGSSGASKRRTGAKLFGITRSGEQQ